MRTYRAPFSLRNHPPDYRQAKITELAQAVRGKENRLVLGLPDVGLRNLLEFFARGDHIPDREVSFIFIHCESLSAYTPETLFDAMAEGLEANGTPDAPIKIDGSGYARLRALVHTIAEDIHGRVVFVIHKADVLVDRLDGNMYRQLKALTDINGQVCLIFSASPHLEGVIDPDGLLFAGRITAVGPFRNGDLGAALSQEAERLGVEFSSAVREKIALTSGGHAGLLRAITSAVQEGTVSEAASLDAWIEALLQRGDVSRRCQRLWEALHFSQQKALQQIADARGDRRDPAYAWLRRYGLIVETEKARIFSPLFARYAQAQMLTLPTIRVEIHDYTSGDPPIALAGKVLQDELEVSVSATEFRLIACLTQAPRVFSKAEVIGYVYYQDQGTGGDYTNALDLMISQVRLKLGHKDYIITHRGTGYEWNGSTLVDD